MYNDSLSDAEGEYMQHVRAVLLIGLLVLLLCSFIVLTIAILPHLPLIGMVASWVITDALICIGIVIPVIAFFFVRWMWFHSSVVRSGEVVVGHYRGEPRLLSAEHEAAKLALPAPRMEITEMRELSAEDKDIIDRSRVLTAHFEEGKGMHAIEKELGIPYNKVRDWCNTAKTLRAQQHQW